MLVPKQAVLTTVAMLLFAGCANSVKYSLSPGGEPAESAGTVVVDKRIETEKKAKILSLSKSNCLYGVYRVGDDQVEPSRLEVLASGLDKRSGGVGAHDTVVVHRFEILTNVQRDLRRALYGAYFGSMAPLVEKYAATDGCGDAFDPQANPENKPAVIVLVDMESRGKRVTGKIVQLEPEPSGLESLRTASMKERMDRAVKAAAKLAADSL